MHQITPFFHFFPGEHAPVPPNRLNAHYQSAFLWLKASTWVLKKLPAFSVVAMNNYIYVMLQATSQIRELAKCLGSELNARHPRELVKFMKMTRHLTKSLKFSV